MVSPVINGVVKWGKFKPLDATLFRSAFYSFEGKECQVVVRPIKKSRSNSQNRYYHGVVCKSVAEHTGHSAEEIHEYLKEKFAPRSMIVDVEIAKSTKQMSTVEMEEYLMLCRAWCSTDLSLYIPLPNEVEF